MTVRILVTCSRSYEDWDTMRLGLARCYEKHPGAILVHGNARKGDQDAAVLWRSLGGEDDPWDADWDTCAPDCKPGHRRRNRWGEYCPTAGMRRNVEMVESAPDLVLAFLDPKSRTRGAFHCAQAAEDAGIPTLYYRQGDAA